MIKLVKPLFTVLLLGAVVFISSCDKDDEPKPKTKTELISAHPWKITKFKVTQGTASFEDAPEACQGDDTETFEADGDYKFDEGATKCDPDDPQSGTGTWTFNSGETVLIISGGGLSLNYTILELTETTMRLKWDFITNETVEVTYEPD